MIELVLFSAAAVEQARYDHTRDMAAVAQLLADVRADKSADGSITLVNRDDPANSNFAAFADYANACGIKEIYAIPSATSALPISVVWHCGSFEKIDGKLVSKGHFAGFWVVDGRVVRLTFGRPPTLHIPMAQSPNDG